MLATQINTIGGKIWVTSDTMNNQREIKLKFVERRK